MLAASDTSPISNLAVIGRLDILQQQFEIIHIPMGVKLELGRLPNAEALASIESAIAEGWIRVHKVVETAVVNLLRTGLHRGEAEAIALGSELPAEVVLIDERPGRVAAKKLGLQVTGVLGVLARAKLHGAIPALRPEIDSLRKRAHFFIAPSLEEALLESAGE